MKNTTTKTDGLPKHVTPELLNVDMVARKLDCSPRHVFRMVDADKMPPPVQLGRLVRWNRQELEQWIADGCPSYRKGGER